MAPYMMKKGILFLLLCACIALPSGLPAQCSSLFTTPEFPIATHPSDGHTQSWGANTFLQSQMGGAASFTGIQIYVDNSFGPTTYASQQVWLRHTAVTSYPNAQYPTTAGFTQCFSGTYSFPMSGLYTIAFNVAPFAYNGGSAVEILFENRSNVYRANEPWFRRTASYGAAVYRSKWNGNFGAGGFPGTAANGSAVRLTYTLSLTAAGGGGCGAILPVAFPGFGAVPEGKAVHCAWDVEEPASGSVSLERSIGDTHFVALQTIVAGATGHFDWIDAQPHVGTNIYRLRSQDSDGNALLSSMVLVDMADLYRLKMYCAPSENGIDVLLDSPDARQGQLEVSDVQGRIVYRGELQLEPGRNHVHVPQAAASGIYLVQVRAGTDAVTSKVIR
jgi:hypothetical protein